MTFVNLRHYETFSNWSVDREIPSSYAKDFEKLLKEYYIVGGMPEAVKEYAETRNS